MLPCPVKAEILNVEMSGAILQFKDGKRGLVRVAEQSITLGWLRGDKVEITAADGPVFRLRSLDTEEVAHVLLYEHNEQLTVLPS